MIYFAIVFIATLVGGISGMGGGVIIKPALDMMQAFDLATISALSSITVLTMCVVSVVKNLRDRFKIDVEIVLLGLASLVGGVAGNQLFRFSQQLFGDIPTNMIQIILSLLFLLFALFHSRFQKRAIQRKLAFIITGFLLGSSSAYIGIGGGAIDVAVLTVFFGFDIKKSVRSSLFIILLSQLMNVCTTAVSPGYGQFDLTPLYYMLPAAVVGGFLGTLLCKKLSEKTVHTIYSITVLAIICLNLYNLVVLCISL